MKFSGHCPICRELPGWHWLACPGRVRRSFIDEPRLTTIYPIAISTGVSGLAMWNMKDVQNKIRDLFTPPRKESWMNY